MPTLRHLHLGMGLLGVLAFLLTGQYMHWALHHLQGMADGPRLFLRSSHVYLLWSSLLNVALGCYFTGSTRTGCRRIQTLASALVIVGPVLLGLSFFFEPYHRTAAPSGTAGHLWRAGRHFGPCGGHAVGGREGPGPVTVRVRLHRGAHWHERTPHPHHPQR